MMDSRKQIFGTDVNKTKSGSLTLKSSTPRKEQKVSVVRSHLKPNNYQCTPEIQRVSLEKKLAHRIRLAVYEGGSVEPKQNHKLRMEIKKALNQKYTRELIDEVLIKCQQPHSELNQFLLQLRWRKAFLVCSVRTKCFREFQQDLSTLLKKHKASYAQAVHMFNNCGIIEAIVSCRIAVNFEELETALVRDAKACECKGIEIIDYETGAVNFKCHSLEMKEVQEKLKSRGYTILHTEYGFQAKQLISLSPEEYKEYEKFLRDLRHKQGIEDIYDNVRHVQQKDKSFPRDVSLTMLQKSQKQLVTRSYFK